jgi:transcriptional regulator with XRE-family HTH domain
MLIRDWRKHHGLSLRDAAQVLGFADGSTILHMERGTMTPGPEHAERIYWTTRAIGPHAVDREHLSAPWRKHNPEKVRQAKAWVTEARKRLKQSKGKKNGNAVQRKA